MRSGLTPARFRQAAEPQAANSMPITYDGNIAFFSAWRFMIAPDQPLARAVPV